MGNVLDSFFTGFFHSIRNFFGSPLDFLSGKSCSSICPSPWDFICYVENFCVANLAKTALVLIVSYCFLFFVYMLYKVGFWHCIIYGFFRLLWSLVSCWFHGLGYCFSFLCNDLVHTKRRDYDDEDSDDVDDDGLSRYGKSRRECRKEERLRKSLRARSHRVRVGVRKDNRSDSGDVGPSHGVRVSRESKFVRKGSKRRTRVPHGTRGS